MGKSQYDYATRFACNEIEFFEVQREDKKERVAELEEIKSGRCCILQMMDCVTGSELRIVHAMLPCVFRHESAEIKDEITTTDPKLNRVNCTQSGNFGHWCWEG